MPKTEDRRIRRTKKALKDALTEILIEGGYESASIQSITDRADLNRATFYLHYGAKEELLLEMLESRFDDLVAGMTVKDWTYGDRSSKDELIIAFQHVADNAPLYRALFQEPKVGYVMQRIIDYIAMVTLEDLRGQNISKEPFPLEIAARSLAGSLFSLMIWWLNNEMPYSVEKMADITADLSAFGIFHLFGMEPKYAPFTSSDSVKND